MTPKIREYMTPAPHSVGSGQTLETAHRLMREHRIRHLPVLRGGELVGLVSLGDLRLVETFGATDPATVLVEEAMTTDLVTVSPDTALQTALKPMLERKLGCVLVVERGAVVGIFTTIDAVGALGALLDERQQPPAPKRRRPPAARAAKAPAKVRRARS